MQGPDNSEWWQDFFTGLWVEVQRHAKSEEQTKQEVDFIVRRLNLSPGARVLDVPCGTGRHAVELAARGFQVRGIDIAPSLIEDGRQVAKERKVAVDWILGDMRDIGEEASYDAIYCFWGSFGYLDDKGNDEFISSVAQALKPGGRFLIDTHVMETLLPRLNQSHAWRRVNDIIVLEERSYSPQQSRTTTEWTLIREGERFTKSTSIRIYSYRELTEMMESAGFAGFEALSGLEDEPFELGAPRLYLTATR